MKRLAYVTNNGIDHILLLSGTGRAISSWVSTPEVIQNFLNPGDLNSWDVQDPTSEASISNYGEECEGERLKERIAFHLGQ